MLRTLTMTAVIVTTAGVTPGRRTCAPRPPAVTGIVGQSRGLLQAAIAIDTGLPACQSQTVVPGARGIQIATGKVQFPLLAVPQPRRRRGARRPVLEDRLSTGDSVTILLQSRWTKPLRLR